MSLINSLKKWLLYIAMPYVEGKTRKKVGIILTNRLEGWNMCMNKLNFLEVWGANFRE